jgi:hypothetical protein
MSGEGKMKVAFKKNVTSVFGAVIRSYTFGPYVHSELVFRNGLWFSSDETDNGTRFIDGPKEDAEYDFIELPISSEDEQRVIDFCKRENGCPYDKTGIGFSFLPIPLGYQNADAWFCSEICTAALQIVGYCSGYTPARVHPNKLYKILQKEVIWFTEKPASQWAR